MPSSPLSLRTKLGYGVADVGASLSYNAVNFFFLFYLVEVIGLRPGLAGVALLSGRLIDAVTDPLMGTLSDRTRSRYGRRKPYIWAGFIPFGLSFALLWTIPNASQSVMFALAALALALHAIIYTVVQVPYMALTPELAPDYQERTQLTSYRIGFGTLASLIAAATPPLLVASLNSAAGLSEEARFGWGGVGVVFGVVMSSSYLLMALNVREPARAPFNDPLEENRQPSLRSVLRVRGYLALIALFSSVTIGLGIVSSMLPFYLASLQLNPGEQTLVLGLLFVVAIAALPLWNVVAARAGKSLALALGLAVLIVGLLLIVLVVPSAGLSSPLIGAVALAGVGTGAALLFPWAMLPDVVEFDLLAHGARREGLLYAVFTFAQKSAFALGAALNALVLELANYTSTAPSSAQSAITWMVGPAAASAFFVALLLAWRYPIRKAEHDAVRKMLEKD